MRPGGERLHELKHSASRRNYFLHSTEEATQTQDLPPLGCRDGRRVNLELVRLSHEGRRGFQGANVGPMAELCLRVAPDHLGNRQAMRRYIESSLPVRLTLSQFQRCPQACRPSTCVALYLAPPTKVRFSHKTMQVRE